MSLNSLHDLFVHQLQDLYSAELQFADAQQKLAQAVTSPELQAGIEQHRQESQQHVARLEQVAGLIGLGSLQGKTCQAAKGLVAEGQELLAEEGEPAVKDAGIIAALQRVEHYEMAGYGTVVAYAGRLGQSEAQALLQQTLDEEKAADAKLSALAEASVNAQAV